MPDCPAHILTDDQFHFAALHRLGEPFLPNLQATLCDCGRPLTHFAHHHHCEKERRITTTNRHDSIARELCKSAALAGLGTRYEPHHRGEDHSLRPDFILYGQDQPLFVDVTIASPEADSMVDQSSHRKLYVAETRSKAKHTKYDQLAIKEGGKFSAFAMETHGGLTAESISIIDMIAKEAEETGVASKRAFAKQIKCNLSFHVQRGNGRMGRSAVARINTSRSAAARMAALPSPAVPVALAAAAALAAAPSVAADARPAPLAALAAVPVVAPAASAAAPHRGRGRPRGSKDQRPRRARGRGHG